MAEEVGLGNDKSIKSGKGRIQVSLLDDTVVAFDVESRSRGEQLYEEVISHLKVEEADYFGLQYYDNEGNMCWLDPQKAINKQVKEASKVTFKFRVMFYTPDPNALQEYTRYLFTLQIRRDLLDGRLHCSEDTGSLLASYIVQGELGDFDSITHQDGYLSGFQFVPNQSPAIEEKIIEYHMTHRGKSPAEADRSMLDVARQLEMYGITLYPAKDRDDADLSLSVFHMGILVFQNQSKINMFSWAKIRKLSFKKKKFIIKLHPRVYTADLVEFVMQSRDACKGFWKICIAHHVFFRQKQAVQKKRKSSVMSRGSKYRYSGKTQKQLVEESRDVFKPIAELERNRASRMHRGSEVQTPVDSINSSDVTAVPITPPPSYSSFKFEMPPPERNQSASSFKNSTDASEDEGSFILGSRKSSQQLEDCKDERKVQQDACLIEQTIIKLQRQDTSEEVADETDVSIKNINDVIGSKSTEELADAGRLRTDSDLEVQRRVNSIFSQIKNETSWQYHLTTTDLDDGDDVHIDDHVDARVDAHVDAHVDARLGDHVNGNADHVNVELNHKLEHVGLNGDLNANDVNEAVIENDDVLLQSKMRARSDAQFCSEDSDSGGSTQEPEKEQDIEDEIEISSIENVAPVENGQNQFKFDSIPYQIAKEILLTERTYVKDLEVLTVSFKELMTTKGAMSESLMNSFFGNIDPLYDFHCSFLAELEDKISIWEGTSDVQSSSIPLIGDVLLLNLRNLKLLTSHINKLDEILMAFYKEMGKSVKLNDACKEFELNRVCYLPLNSFLLKPAQRLLYYRSILSRLYKEFNDEDINHQQAKSAYQQILEIFTSVSAHSKSLENLHKLIELDRDLSGVENIVHPAREFIREGCLYKMCRKGPQPRMFFLFSDSLIYTKQGVTQANQFRVRSYIPIHTIEIEEDEAQLHGLYSFTISSNCGKPFIVAATSNEERFKWMEDIKVAKANTKTKSLCPACKEVLIDTNSYCSSCKKCYENGTPTKDWSLSNVQMTNPLPITIKKHLKEHNSDDEEPSLEEISSLDQRHARVRTLSTRRVCWHRHTSISMSEYKISVQNNLSGELYRKSKNQSKWQRLWVVFTNFSLFFFRSCEDDEPLASLPLIGYSISKPSDTDDVNDEFAFKLQFKAHINLFKAESHYAWTRWTEVISSAVTNSSRARIFSRLKSN